MCAGCSSVRAFRVHPYREHLPTIWLCDKVLLSLFLNRLSLIANSSNAQAGPSSGPTLAKSAEEAAAAPPDSHIDTAQGGICGPRGCQRNVDEAAAPHPIANSDSTQQTLGGICGPRGCQLTICGPRGCQNLSVPDLPLHSLDDVEPLTICGPRGCSHLS